MSDGTTRRRMNEREWQCFEDGVKYERERIIKLLKVVKVELRKTLANVAGDSQSETYWYSRIQALDNYIAFIKGAN